MQVSYIVHFRTVVATSATNPIFPNPSKTYDELTHNKIDEPRTNSFMDTSHFNTVALSRRQRF